MKRQSASAIKINREPLSIEELIKDYLRFPSVVAFFGKKKELDRVLGQIPYFLTLEMNNEVTPESILGAPAYFDRRQFIIPPAWYSAFCQYCEKNKDQKCALIIRGLTKCEPSRQVYLNTVLGERTVKMDDWPLPSNSSVFVMVEDKDEADYQYYNLTEQVFRRITPFYLKNYKWKDELEAESSSDDK